MNDLIGELDMVIRRASGLAEWCHRDVRNVPDTVNGPTWALGHATVCLNDMVLLPLVGAAELPPGYEQFFGYDCSKDDRALYPTFDVVHAEFRRVAALAAEAMREVDPVRLGAAPGPFHFVSNRHAIVHALQDIAYHTGQMRYLLLLLGPPSPGRRPTL